MPIATETPATPVIEKARRTPKPRRHPLEENPPPPMRVCTIDQEEAEHPGIKGRLRQWIKRADAGDPSYRWLVFCIVRVGGSVFIDDVKFRDGLHQRTAITPAPSRNAVRG
jgi:hypothetical protein